VEPSLRQAIIYTAGVGLTDKAMFVDISEYLQADKLTMNEDCYYEEVAIG